MKTTVSLHRFSINNVPSRSRAPLELLDEIKFRAITALPFSLPLQSQHYFQLYLRHEGRRSRANESIRQWTRGTVTFCIVQYCIFSTLLFSLSRKMTQKKVDESHEIRKEISAKKPTLKRVWPPPVRMMLKCKKHLNNYRTEHTILLRLFRPHLNMIVCKVTTLYSPSYPPILTKNDTIFRSVSRKLSNPLPWNMQSDTICWDGQVQKQCVI